MSILGDFFQDLLGIDEPEQQTGTELNKSSNVDALGVVYGIRRVNGTRVFMGSAGTNNEDLYMVVAWCEGEVSSIQGIRVDDKPLSEFQSKTGTYPTFGTPTANTKIEARNYLGTDSQPADSLMVSTFTQWTSLHKLSGVAYTVFRFRYNAEVFSGKPEVSAVIAGKKVLNVTSGLTKVTTNAAWNLRDYLLNDRYGKGLATTDINEAAFAAAAVDCDQLETLVNQVSWGQPSTVVTEGDFLVLSFATIPTDAFIVFGATLQNAASGATKIATVIDSSFNRTWLGPAFGQIGGRWLVTVEMTTGSDFTTGDTLWADAEATRVLQCNTIIDTSKSVLENTKQLLAGMRGSMAFVQGQYFPTVEKDRASVFDFNHDNILGGFTYKGVSKKDKLNRCIARYADPATNWKDNVAVFPVAGDATDIALLAEDNGTRLSAEIELPTVTNYHQANDFARMAVYRSRNGITCSFKASPAALVAYVGAIVTVTHTTPGWSSKKFRVTRFDIDNKDEVTVELTEHNAAVYTWAYIDPVVLRDDTDLPSPYIVAAPTGLTATVTTTTELDGVYKPAILLTWTAAADPFIDRYEVQYKENGDSTYNSLVTNTEQISITGLRLSTSYDLRVKTFNQLNKSSDWATTTKTISADVTPPGNITGVTVTEGVYSLLVDFTRPTDSDYSHCEVYINTVNSIPVSAWIDSAYGNSVSINGLTSNADYYVWLKPVDKLGNVGSATASVQASTLIAPSSGNRILPRYAGGWMNIDAQLPYTGGTELYAAAISIALNADSPTAGYYGTHALKVRSKAGAVSAAAMYFGTASGDYNMVLDPNSEWLFRCKAWAETNNTEVRAYIRTDVAQFYALPLSTTKTLTPAKSWIDWAGSFDLSAESADRGIFRIDVVTVAEIVWFDGLMLEKKIENNSVAGIWQPPNTYSNGGNTVEAARLIAGSLGSGFTADDGSGQALAIAKDPEYGYAYDGSAITFTQEYDKVPIIQFGNGGILSDTGLTGPDQHLVVEAEDLTTTGFTMKAVLREGAGTVVPRSETTATEIVTDLEWQMHKAATTLSAWNDLYTFTFDVTVINKFLYSNFIQGSVYTPGSVVVACSVALSGGIGSEVWTQVAAKSVSGSFNSGSTTVNNVSVTGSIAGLTQHTGREFKIEIFYDAFPETSGGSTLNNFDSVTYSTATAPAEVTATPTSGGEQITAPILYTVITS